MSTSDYWRRFSKQRLSRRRALAAGAAGMGAAALGLAGCGGDKDEEGKTPAPSTPVSETPKTGGIYRQASVATALSIDPHTEIAAGLGIIPFIYGYLTHNVQMPDGPPQDILDHAASVEQPEDLTYVFKLRQGIHFQNLPPVNGREVVAEDVVYSFDRIASASPEPLWKTYLASKAATDPYTVQIGLSKPYAYTMEDMGSVRTAIVPKEAVEEWENLETRGLGSGPFMVKDFSRGNNAEVTRNPDYYGDAPYLDGMSWRTIADDAALRVAFRAKELDVYAPPTKLQADEVAGYGSDVIMTKEPFLLVTKMGINEVVRPELGDVRVREALDIGVDRDAMIEKLCFGEGNYTGPVSWGLTFWSLPQEELRQRFKRDIAKARQLLEAAGASDLTLELKFPTTTSSDVCAMIKDQLADIGVNINLVAQEFGTWIADRSARKYELIVGGGLPYGSEKYPLQFNHTRDWTRDSIPVHEPEPEIDAMLDQVMATPDVNERQKLVLEVTRKLLDRHGPILYLYAPYAFTARWNYVRGYEDVPSGMTLYTYDIWLNK